MKSFLYEDVEMLWFEETGDETRKIARWFAFSVLSFSK